MRRRRDNFHLIDLASQAAAVQALLAGRPPEEKLAWFAAHGKLAAAPGTRPGPQVYLFESFIGRQCLFFISGDSLVFIGDNTTWSVPPE